MNTPLPEGFLWGAATAAYQIEGAVDVDGRLPSIWDDFCRVPGAIDGGDTGDVVCDHYRRWPEDIALMRELNLEAYRFSVAWPRVIPTGRGAVNAKGLDFYDRLVDALLEAGIRPFATLYHWDLPSVLQDKGGWPERDTAYAFAEYAEVVARRLGDRVQDWTTLNEPLCSAWIGHLEGRFAPGERDITRAVHASHHLLLAHGLGMQAVRANAEKPARLGIVLNPSGIAPATDRPEDVAAAKRMDGHVNRWWMDPTNGRGYPADMVEVYGVEPPVHGGDLELIGAPVDYHGVNFYFRQFIVDDPEGPAPYARQVPVEGAKTTSMGWEVYAQGLTDVILRFSQEYGARSIYVTESGSAWNDTVAPDGSVHDPERTAYLEDHLEAVARAIAEGAPVDGYFAWSLLDNFEWANGLDKRFGLVRVDFETQQRTVKTSGRRYAELIAQHRATRGGSSA
ncbi:GH1 family beta-glucosidase [Actinocorallia sp. A-T 12471]|uniref:GH1 family beta-glucosidase n=1 Tax=Actinocorallia sp. A-T 12471 TaxID=3089813 RepID=UPI0029CBEDE7|nr:GH1 family beta-glucosidase [Actinocorallia sp. A-T 12471]MDX6740501.1 GH1 family beta-glucosidase [Actinocorallia sp. A-T 12471]